MRYTGDVALPDGRIVSGEIGVVPDGPGNIMEVVSVDLVWAENDQELTTDEYNELVQSKQLYDLSFPGMYLHEYVTDKVLRDGDLDEDYPE